MTGSRAKITALRNSFFGQSDRMPTPSNEIERRILSEWQASRLHKIDHRMTHLGDSCQDLATASRITTIHKTYWNQLKSYYDNKHRVLESLGAAIFYTDEKCSIFNKAGNKRLLEQFKSMNIHFGTNLDVESIGAGPISTANQTPFTTVVRIGAENYLDMFQVYALYARNTPKTKYCINPCTLIVLPLDNYNETADALMRYALEAEDIIMENDLMLPYVEHHEKLMELAMADEEDGFLIMGADGAIEYANKAFTSEFDSPSSQIRHKSLLEYAMPELRFTLDCLAAGKGFLPREVRLKNKNNKENLYYLEARILKSGAKIYGLKLTVKKSSMMRKYLSFSENREARFTFDSLVGANQHFVDLKLQSESAAKTSTSILITGESGTGKELFAQSIHNASTRKAKRFIPLNCAAIPKELIGSELFGYEEGAFTGARKGGQIGKFEQADRGTIFLDEIAEMPLDMQAVLLRFLEDGIVTRLGGSKPIPLNVRIIAATNRDLRAQVEDGKFRLDLFFRLNVININLPPLRERIDDIKILVDYFLNQISSQLEKPKPSLSNQTMELFHKYHWPGNLRELRNSIERIVVLCDRTVISPDDLPKDLQEMLLVEAKTSANRGQGEDTLDNQSESASLRDKDNGLQAEHISDLWGTTNYRSYENRRIEALMIEHRGNKTKVAKCLGMSRATLYRRLHRIEFHGQEN